MTDVRRDGLLAGVRVVELLGIGPEPFAGMMLADLGAEVVGLRRPGQQEGGGGLERGRPVVTVDLKDAETMTALRDLVEHADVFLEGYRPGVAERLGLGPDECLTLNPALVYGRMTGWGQSGPLAQMAGHDINYIAITGALHAASRRGQPPVPPANLLGDFGAGGMYLVAAVLAALVERSHTGIGRVLDIAITDGTTYLTSMLHGMRADGQWSDEPGTNLLDTGAPFYDVYQCADGRYVAVGALEPKFFAALVTLLGLDPALCATRDDRATWPALRLAMAVALRTRTRDEWAALADGTDACLAPVLTVAEAPDHPHARARSVFHDDMPALPLGTAGPGQPVEVLAASWGVDPRSLEAIRSWTARPRIEENV